MSSNKPRIKDFSDEQYLEVTDGCGCCSLRAKLHGLPLIGGIFKGVNHILEPVCRRHDFRYARGYKGRLLADALLLIEGTGYVLALICLALLALPILIIYVAILLPSGWYTFTRFGWDGLRLTKYSKKSDMISRAALRRHGKNPEASYHERSKAKKENRHANKNPGT